MSDAELPAIKNAIESTVGALFKPSIAVRPKLMVPGASEDRQELLHTLMDTYVKNDVLSIQQSIVNRELVGCCVAGAAAAGRQALLLGGALPGSGLCAGAGRPAQPAARRTSSAAPNRSQPLALNRSLSPAHHLSRPARRGVHDGAVALPV